MQSKLQLQIDNVIRNLESFGTATPENLASSYLSGAEAQEQIRNLTAAIKKIGVWENSLSDTPVERLMEDGADLHRVALLITRSFPVCRPLANRRKS